jgi:hypothetical protein
VYSYTDTAPAASDRASALGSQCLAPSSPPVTAGATGEGGREVGPVVLASASSSPRRPFSSVSITGGLPRCFAGVIAAGWADPHAAALTEPLAVVRVGADWV